MHVLIVPSERYGDPDRPMEGIFQRDQARALRGAGLEVGMLAPAPRSLRHLRQAPRRLSPVVAWEERGVRVLRADAHNWTTGRLPRAYHHYWRHLADGLYRRYVQRWGRPDVLHAHNLFDAGVWAAGSRVCRDVPLVITEHSSMYWRAPLARWQRRAGDRALARAAARLTVGRRLGERMEEIFGAAMTPWRVVPNVLPEEFEAAAPAPLAGARGPFVFTCVAALTPVKNHAGLLDAFAQQVPAAANGAACRLELVGDGELRGELEARASRLGLGGQVRFRGYLPRAQVLEAIAASDAVVLASRAETFGVAVLEALALGKPVIAVRGSGPDDFVSDADGLLVDPGDTAGLARALDTMRREHARFDAAGIRARCLARFGAASIAGQLLAEYRAACDAVADSRRRGRP